MSSNGSSISEKPKGVESDSSPGPIKPIGTPHVSSNHSIGDLHSKRDKGEASVTSGLTKLSGKTAVSSGVLIGVPMSKNPNGAIIHSTKAGVSSGVRGKSVVSSRVRGKAIETVIQGFIPAGRIDTYLPHMRAGALALSSMTPSRVFLDKDVQTTEEYLTWMNANLSVANRVNADVVTKTETMTIGELLFYIQQEDAKNGVADGDPSTCVGIVKRAADKVEAEDPKRARCG
ncbi:hypothetical protein YC2023_051963 [Brassica napus]